MPFAETLMDLETVIQSEVSQKEKQILYINAYMWNLGGKWHRWSYLQTINRDKCREQMHGHQRGKEKWDELGDWDWHIYPTMYKIGN